MSNADLAYQHALDQLARGGFEAMPERERDLAALWHVEAAVTNGGLIHYYSGSGADLAFHAPAAFARIGALGKADIIRTANALFGPSGPPRNRRLRQIALKFLDARAFTTIDELEERYYQDPLDVDELVEAFLSEHAELPLGR